ncbi:MAG TPA: cupredoxin family copper-binding protein [Stellaceae bacterium]|nr:cupredoxin family copper-binding protein [Stellaceae bacterium]
MTKHLLFAAAFAAMPLAAQAQQVAATPMTIEIQNMKFSPAILTITAGATVTWVNEDQMPHTIADRERAFRSAALDTKDSFSHTFATPGEFTYFCTLHPMMVGKIVVKPAGSSS